MQLFIFSTTMQRIKRN